jgi:hypothetical protein
MLKPGFGDRREPPSPLYQRIKWLKGHYKVGGRIRNPGVGKTQEEYAELV